VNTHSLEETALAVRQSAVPSVQGESSHTRSRGRYVVFDSYATNIALGIDNGWPNFFVHDRQTGLTECLCEVRGWRLLMPFLDEHMRWIA
jgi:hypothetical protein